MFCSTFFRVRESWWELYILQIRTILDIGCGYGSFGAHLLSKQLLTMCIANYETSGSQVQLTLERGLPAMLGSFASKQLPYPSFSFDMVHCAHCAIDWDQKGISQNLTLLFILFLSYASTSNLQMRHYTSLFVHFPCI